MAKTQAQLQREHRERKAERARAVEAELEAAHALLRQIAVLAASGAQTTTEDRPEYGGKP